LLKFDRRAPASALIENSVGMISENCSTVCVHKRSLSDVVYITVRIDMATIPMSAVSMISLNSYTNRDVCNAKPNTRSLREPESTYPHFGSGDSEFSRHTFGIALSPRKAVATLRHETALRF
jgi:hypothetical protein